MSDSACRNCGTALADAFCPHCGQAARENHPPTLAHLGHDLVHEFTHLDGKILRTLGALFGKPGQLTREFWDGRRALWVRPFRVFLVFAAVHFLVVQSIGPLNFDIQLERGPTGDLMVRARPGNQTEPPAAGAQFAPEAERTAYLARIQRTYSIARYAAVPIFALAAWAVYRRRQKYFANHMVFAAHLYAFAYALGIAASWLPTSRVVTAAVMVATAAYLFLALRRVYGGPAGGTLARAIGLYAILVAVEMSLVFLAIGWAGSGL